MKFTLSIAMNPLDQVGELARAAEEAGFASIALPDSLFYAETVATDYVVSPEELPKVLSRGKLRSVNLVPR